jgi:uncharacterized protein YdaU (DUF1376 family)
MQLDNGGPLLEDDATQRMRWVKVNPHELLEGIAELSMEERGFYMTLFFSMYARMGGVPFDEHELAKLLRMDKRVVRRLRDLVLNRGKLYVLDGELRQRRVDHEITEYTRKAKKYLAAAAEREEKRRKLALVADEIQKTSGKLPADFSQTSARSSAEVPGSSDQKSNKINVCAAQILREPEPEPEPEPEKKDTKQRSDTTPAAAPLSLDEFENKLLDACNGALANPCNSQGLLNLAIPQMWLNSGADLELDVLPTLRAVGKRDHGKGIASWAYFTKAVADTVAKRKAGMPAGHAGKPSKPQIRRFAR